MKQSTQFGCVLGCFITPQNNKMKNRWCLNRGKLTRDELKIKMTLFEIKLENMKDEFKRETTRR